MTRLDYFFAVNNPVGHYHYDYRTFGPLPKDGRMPAPEMYLRNKVAHFCLVYGRYKPKWPELESATHRDLCPPWYLEPQR
jgi:hypothetical protein